MALLYLGPEVLMPIASVVAAIGGALLMFWNRVRVFFSRVFRGRTDHQVTSEVESDTDLA